MLEIDEELLSEVGLEALPKWERDLLLSYIYETLEMRVGVKLADRFSSEELDEFEVFFEKGDDDGAFEWLQENAPYYKDVVNAEFTLLKKEIVGEAGAILAASRPERAAVEEDEDEVVAEVLAEEPARKSRRPGSKETKTRGRR